MANALVPVQLEYKVVCNRHKEIEDELNLILSGTNVTALREFKGGQPSSFPSLAESLHTAIRNPEPIAIEWGTLSPPHVSRLSTINHWTIVSEAIRNHKKLIDSFLTAPNLTFIDKARASKALMDFEKLQPLANSLEEKAIALSAPEQAVNTARLKNQLALKRQWLILGAGLLLFSVGVFVFARASINWYEQVQRFEDAKLQGDAKSLGVPYTVSIKGEVLWLCLPAAIAAALLIFFICIGF